MPLLRSGLETRNVESISLKSIAVPLLFSFRGEELGEETAGLIESIRRYGVLQPALVRRTHVEGSSTDDGLTREFELISGKRRYAACERLGLDSIPCIVMRLDDQEAFEVALVENVQRQNLNPIEEAEAFKSYVMNFGRGSVTRLAKKIGKSEEYVSHRLLLLGLPKILLDRISKHLLNPSVATELVWIKDSRKQVELANGIERSKLSLRQVRMAANMLKSGRIPVGEALDKARNFKERARTQLDWASGRGSKFAPWPVDASQEDSDEFNELAVLSHAELVLRGALVGLDQLVQKMTTSSAIQGVLVRERRSVHNILDDVIRTKITLKRQRGL